MEKWLNIVKKAAGTFTQKAAGTFTQKAAGTFTQKAAGTFLMVALIPLGKTEALKIRSQQAVHVSDGKIVKIREKFGRLLATGSRLGSATITTKDSQISVYVLNEQDVLSYKKLEPLIKKMMGLEISIQNNKVIISGHLLRFSDWEKLVLASQDKSLPWILKATMTKEISQKILDATKEKLSLANLPIPSLSTSPLFEAHISNSPQYSQAFQDLLSPLGFQIHQDAQALETAPVVDLKVQMVELRKSSFSKLGVDLPQSYKAQVIPDNKFKISGTPFDIALNMLEQDGVAKIIAEPHLSCRSGKEAKFLAGGEIPIKIINFETHDIQWKKYGILLTFKPNADRNGMINLSLTAEISMLDQAQAVDGIPGLLVNRVESHLNLKDSQTIALSGLVKQHTGQSQQGLAGLKNIPILGNLFSSKDYREERTDLVVFVTPKTLQDSEL